MDRNLYKKYNKEIDFERWFEQYKPQWCQHWNINDWSIEEMFSVIPIGEILNIDLFDKTIQDSVSYIKMSLQK
jgi:hypothetical protein